MVSKTKYGVVGASNSEQMLVNFTPWTNSWISDAVDVVFRFLCCNNNIVHLLMNGINIDIFFWGYVNL